MAGEIAAVEKIILEVPYRSQFGSISKEKWKPRACTLACLKMAMDFLAPHNSKSADELFAENQEIQKSMLEKGLITEKLAESGSVHEAIVFLAHNHGLPAYKEEFKSLDERFKGQMLEAGIEKLLESIRSEKPVIVSILPGLSRGQSFHTILLIGYEADAGGVKGFYYHDPDAPEGPLDSRFISLDKFIEYWRRLAIFIG